jgi:hypothetical protein
MQPRRFPPIRIELAAGDNALGKNEARLWTRKDHPANENRRLKQEGRWRQRFYLLFAKH